MLKRLLNRSLDKEEFLTKQMTREIRKASKRKIPKDVCAALALRTVRRFDYNNHYQMHKSLQAYAELIAHRYLKTK